MGCGGREVTLEIFESYLKKLLHMIDKLPTVEKEKAVRIMKNSANQYYNLTLGEQIQVSSADFFSHSQEQQQPFPSTSSLPLLDTHTTSPFSPLPATDSPSKSSCVPVSSSAKLESEAILEEISDLAEGSQGLSCLGGSEDTAESWDRHLDITTTTTTSSSHNTSHNTYPVNQRCISCDTTFASHREFTSHYLPVSCIGCRKEFCNNDIYVIHYHSCKAILHYRVKHTAHLNTTVEVGQQPPAPPPPPAQDINLNEKSGNKKHKCPQCQLEFSTAFQLNKHIKGHNDNNCQKCDAKFAKRRFLVNHLKTVHYISTAEKYYNCKFCPRKFVKKPSLWAHYSEHTVASQVVCLKCGEILEDSDLLKKHVEEHRSKARHTCQKCGDFFIRKQQYLAHLDGHEKHRCKICLKDFSSKKKLKHHRNFEHDPNNGAKKKAEKIPDPVQNPNFTCVVCLQSYRNEALFNSHNCLEDAKKKEKTKTVSKDVSIKVSASKYKCRYCDFEHKKNSAVVRHARSHRNKKRFVCEQCGAAFNAHYTLKEHRIYVHSEDRKFSCTKCDKSFKARNALIRHEQVHSDKRPFACHCGQMFKRSSHLKRHLATSHKGEPEVGRTEQDWDKTSWESPGKYGPALPPSVALDVVTSLDLNMKQDKEMLRPGKYEKEKSQLVGSERGRERGEEGLYHEEYRGYQGGHRYTGYYPGPGPGVRQEKYEEERLYQLQPQSVLDDRGYSASHSQLERTSEAGPASLEQPLFPDSGPADLTVSRADNQMSQYRNQSQSRPRYTNFISTSRPSYHHQPYPLRLPVSASMEAMEDPYQGYSQRQPGQYFDQLDSYLPPGREEMEMAGAHQSCEKKKLSRSTEKYYRQDGQEVMGHTPAHREDGLLPPLLALAPHHGPGQAGGKMDYLCSTQTDHYIQDGSLDYNITEY